MIEQDEFRLKVLTRVAQEHGGKLPLADLWSTREQFILISSMYRAGWFDRQRRGGVGYLRITGKGRAALKAFERICGG